MVLTLAASRPAIRVRTVLRRPVEERWSRADVLNTAATVRVPDLASPGRGEIPTPKQARILESRAMFDERGAAVQDEEPDDEDDDGVHGSIVEGDPPADDDRTDVEAMLRSFTEADARDS